MLGILAEQTTAIEDAAAQTDGVLDVLARRDRAVRGFVANAATLTDTTAGKHAELRRSVRDLPAMLRQARTSLSSLEDVADRLTPTARALREAAPELTTLERLTPPLARQALPALAAARPALRQTRRAAEPATKLVGTLTTAVSRSRPTAGPLVELLDSTRRSGGFEGLQNLIYGFAATTGPYDAVGHAAAITVTLDARCILDNNAAGCSHKFNAPGKGQIPHNDPSAPSLARAGERSADPLAERLPRSSAKDLRTVLDRVLR